MPFLRLVVLLSLRSLAAHKVKSTIVGSLLFVGTFLVVTGHALLNSVENAMRGTITSSMAGELQLYAADAKDPLELFGGMGMGSADIGEIPAFQDLAPLGDVENVKTIVPMGITTATVFTPNEIDDVLDALRDAVTNGDVEGQAMLGDRVRHVARSLRGEQDQLKSLMADMDKWEANNEALERVDSDSFWVAFKDDPLPALDYLDTNIAPQARDGRLLYLRTVGTDLDLFAQSFDRFYIVDGEPVPTGKRGFLFSKRSYELLVKIKVARELDDVYKQVTTQGKRIADDPLLQEQVIRNARQVQRILLRLTPEGAAELDLALQDFLANPPELLEDKVAALLTLTDENIEAHVAFFYDVVASLVPIYPQPIGEPITLRAYTKSGYVRSINVPVYGTYEFRGLEQADLTSASNLMDLVTFRQLFGKMSDTDLAELEDIRIEVAVEDVNRASAEDMLFGGGGLVTEDEPIEEDNSPAPSLEIEIEQPQDLTTYAPSAAKEGLVLNAAVLLEDPDKIEETQAALQATIDANQLNVQVVDWQAAAGMLGQFVVVMQVILGVALLVIFLVALIIINNSMVMTTMDRITEIGTMRAIGAQRSLVVSLFLCETLWLGTLSGLLGAGSGALFVGWLGEVGIPAGQDALVLLFAGPRLYPDLTPPSLVFGLIAVLTVSLLSTLYPSVLAARVPPIVALGSKE